LNPLTVILLAMVPASFAGLVYLYWLRFGDGAKSKIMTVLIVPVSTLVWISGAYLCIIAAVRVEHGLVGVPEWTVWITTLLGILLCVAVAFKALYFRSQR
jgi:uncharacterized protein involved in cysteine biosynthesis